MNDLRHDPTDAHAPDLRECTAPSPSGIARAVYLDPADLRTVSMPELRTPEARTLDAETRDLRPYDTRCDERMAAIEQALECIADAVTVLMLERDVARMEREAAR